MHLRQAVQLTGSIVLLVACSRTSGSTAAVSTPEARPVSPQSTVQQPTPQAQPAAVNPKGAATKAFLDRMAEYARFHSNVEKMVPPLVDTTDPEKIASRERALGEALIKSRPDAKQGDFFIEEYQPYLIEIIKQDFARRSLVDRKALIVELPKGVKVDVNTIYPTILPLATFPPNLLKALPELPGELEYRIVGRDLILLDPKGNVVVDVMRNVFPIPT